MAAVERVAEGVQRVSLITPTLPPATSTNAMIVGAKRLAVIEPATPHADEQRRLDAVLAEHRAGGAEVVAILITHHHADHTGYVVGLRERLGVPVYAHAATAQRVDFTVDEVLGDGDVLELDDGHALEAVHTPGHAPGHLVYLDRKTRIAHAGDMVAGEGWIMIDPDDDGDMAAYLRSLHRLRGLADALVPAHGPVIDEPAALIDRYVAHRLERERRVLDAVPDAGAPFDAVLATAYDDTPRVLWPLARRSLEAHVRKLVDDGHLTREGDHLHRTS